MIESTRDYPEKYKCLLDDFLYKIFNTIIAEDLVSELDSNKFEVYFDLSMNKDGKYGWYCFHRFENALTVCASIDIKKDELDEKLALSFIGDAYELFRHKVRVLNINLKSK